MKKLPQWLKLAIVCLLCIGIVAVLTLIIQLII
jgi:hypothetical protein